MNQLHAKNHSSTVEKLFHINNHHSPQQSINLDQQPLLITAPPGTVAAELVDDGEQGLVLLDREVGDSLGGRDRGQDELVENLVHALARDRLVAAAVRRLAHHLGRRRGALI